MPNSTSIQTIDLGQAGYGPVLERQRLINQQVIDGQSQPTLFMVEHDPVITLTRRPSVRENLLADDTKLAKLGIATHQTDRGGDITYHGPGQLVVYPILKLGDYGLNLSSYMRLLEQAIIDTVATWGIEGYRECGAAGVWVSSPEACGLRLEGERDSALVTTTAKPQAPGLKPTSAKLCAMGVRIRKNTTMHGLALNVDPDMAHFDLIVPCGLAERSVTSLKQLLGDDCPTMQQVKTIFEQTFRTALMCEDKPACLKR